MKVKVREVYETILEIPDELTYERRREMAYSHRKRMKGQTVRVKQEYLEK